MLKRPVTVICALWGHALIFIELRQRLSTHMRFPFLSNMQKTHVYSIVCLKCCTTFSDHIHLLCCGAKVIVDLLEIVNRVLKQQTKQGVLLCTSGFISAPPFFVQTTCSPFLCTLRQMPQDASRIFTKK